MENKASMTALMSAFTRAYHCANNQEPVFKDTIAKKLMTLEEYKMIAGYIMGGKDFFAKGRNFNNDEEALKYIVDFHLGPTPLARARFCEDSLKREVKTGVSQYVILGAGLDSFPWRELKLMEKLVVFEVDHPATQEDKVGRLEKAGLEIPANLKFVPMDFRCDDLKKKLLQAGFDPSKKTFFSWLGVTYYLDEEAIKRTFHNIAQFAAEGSSVVFDYPDEDYFNCTETRVKNNVAMAAASGEPMKFSCDEFKLMSILDKENFLIYELMTPDDINYKYFNDRSDGMDAFPHVNYVLAVLKGTPFINTKEKILQSSLDLFSKYGFTGVSVKNIADSLAITKGALYKHYENKRAIFDSIVERMATEDGERAKKWRLPEEPKDQDDREYQGASIENLVSFTKEQFRYWTEDAFALRFRRMLTLEQYGSEEMQKLYNQYLCQGPWEYTADILEGLVGSRQKAEEMAEEFYGPVYFMYTLYEAAEDKSRVVAMLDKHLEEFKCKMQKI